MVGGAASGATDGGNPADNDEMSRVLPGSPSLTEPPSLDLTPFATPPADEPLSWPAVVFVVVIGLIGVLLTIISVKPATTLVAYLVALAPSVLVAALIVYRLRDPVISKTFLLGIVFITSVPGILAIMIVGKFRGVQFTLQCFAGSTGLSF
jgi:hypothetical protein